MKIRVGARRIEISHPDKMMFPDAGLSKADMARYYHRIGPRLLPYLKGRPLTLERYPNGIDTEGFVQQEATESFPDYLKRAPLERKSGGVLDHILVSNIASLVYLANLGVITLHAWQSRIDSPDRPDRMIFDLDPSQDDFSHVIESALLLRRLLTSLGLYSKPMTTGSRGLHVVVPLDRGCDFAEVRRFARDVASILAARHANLVTTEQRKENRRGRLYLDVMRNGYNQTGVVPYGVRARAEAPVAAPLDWQDLRSSTIGPRSYRIDNIFRRLGQKGDPWKGIGRRARSLSRPRGKLDRFLSRDGR